jgi:hypothetical protein
MPRVSGDVLDAGQELIVAAESSPHEFRCVRVARVRDGLIWVCGLEPQGEGERVFMECRRHNDAVYRALAKVVFVPPESWALRRVGDWDRLQRRETVRVTPRGLDIELISDEDGTGIASFPVVDLSCGGVRVRTAGVAALELTPGRRVRCAVDLPDLGAIELRAQVIRAAEPEADEKSAAMGLRFIDVDPAVESLLARWVLREQARLARVR